MEVTKLQADTNTYGLTVNGACDMLMMVTSIHQRLAYGNDLWQRVASVRNLIIINAK